MWSTLSRQLHRAQTLSSNPTYFVNPNSILFVQVVRALQRPRSENFCTQQQVVTSTTSKDSR